MRTQSLAVGLYATLGLLVGCATLPAVTPTQAPEATAMTQASVRESATDRMFHWREEARELHEMADHREREADLLSKSLGGTTMNDDVAHLRSLATQLRAAAEYADEQAREAQREVPHGIIQ